MIFVYLLVRNILSSFVRHSPLREASPSFSDPKLGLRFLCCQRASQPTAKPLPQKLPDFSFQRPLRATKGYKPSWLAWLGQWCSRSPGVSSGTPCRSPLPYATTTAACRCGCGLMGGMPSSTAWVAGVTQWQWQRHTPSPPKSGATTARAPLTAP